MALHNKIFGIKTEADFTNTALEIYEYQKKNNPVYSKYIELSGLSEKKIKSIKDIPFLPIEFFKSHDVLCKSQDKEKAEVFTSSGTSGEERSKHYVSDIQLYETSFIKSFNLFYGAEKDYCIFALLPSYLERTGSSLIYMADKLIKNSRNPASGFYLNNIEELYLNLTAEDKKGKVLLIGVSFALIEFVEKYKLDLNNTIVMETGGMKGRRKEIIRTELHEIIKAGTGVKEIHSEYGMTELLSQAYSTGDGIFSCPPWMKIMIRDSTDPFSYVSAGLNGGINIIDLANIYSCSFIETQDIGAMIGENKFEVKGRFDNSDIRGCNLLVL